MIPRQPTGDPVCVGGRDIEIDFTLFSNTTGLHISTQHGLKIQKRRLESEPTSFMLNL